MVLETARLSFHELTYNDAEFILQLLNEPSFIENIGDRGIRTRQGAEKYIAEGPVQSYQQHDLGLYLVKHKESAAAIGICGLIKRDNLPGVDLGFAYLPAFWSQGFAFEAAQAILERGKNHHKLKRILAIVSPENFKSSKLLEKLGFQFESMIKLKADAPEIKLFALSFHN